MKITVPGDANRKHSHFKPDPDVPTMFTAENKDYWRSGWSRGHMAPAGDNKHDQVRKTSSRSLFTFFAVPCVAMLCYLTICRKS